MSETNTVNTVESKGAKGESKGAKGASKAPKGAKSKAPPKLEKGAGARGAFGGRGARTILIENFIASSKAPVSVRDVENATTKAHEKLTGAPIRAVRNHVVTYLYAIRRVLGRDESGRYFVKGAEKKSKKGAKKSK